MSNLKFSFAPDISLQPLEGRKIVIIGYGSQGRAQALNARDAGFEISVALPKESATRARVLEDGFELVELENIGGADIVLLLAPDSAHAEIWESYLRPNMKLDAYLGVSHGFAFRFNLIRPLQPLKLFLVAPKGSGAELRLSRLDSAYKPVMARIATWENREDSLLTAQAWGKAIGCADAGLLETSFKEETDTNLFGEQAIILGGVWAIVKSGFEIMVDMGYSPEMAYLESAHSLRIVADLIHDHGIAQTNELISHTAEFGGYLGERALPVDLIKERMRKLMRLIQDGTFEGQLAREIRRDYPITQDARLANRHSLLESTGARLREILNRGAN